MIYNLLTYKAEFDALIVAAGDFPQSNVALAVLKHTRPLIVCDSALENIIKYNQSTNAEGEIIPDAVVGDGDSLPSSLKEQYAGIWHQIDEQYDNDLTKATTYALKNYNGLQTIAYLATTGRREDHTIGNLSLMIKYFRDFNLAPYFITDYGWFNPAKGNNVFESFEGEQISIFNIDCKVLKSDGLKWGIYPFTELWQGTLNEATGSAFSIEADNTYVVFHTFERKELSD